MKIVFTICIITAIMVFMFTREITNKALELAQSFPALTILGPRQSGKTTLVKTIFSEWQYVNLEDLSIRDFAKSDPKGFLHTYGEYLIIDEIQNVPELLSYLQIEIDYADKTAMYILTGSRQISLNESISQSLAGRTGIINLLSLSYAEIKENYSDLDFNDLIFKGFYPRIYKFNIPAHDFYNSYIQTYIERDIRQIKNITNLDLFRKFIKLCAGRVSQILNLSALANDCGISHVTAREWISLLESSFIIYLLPPYYNNFKKRIIKSPKLYFYDPGIVCHLLNINTPEEIETHYAKGALFENFIISEIIKKFYNNGQVPPIYFWQNKTGHEIDLIIEQKNSLLPIEIKSGRTINSDFFTNIKYWQKLTGQTPGYIVFGGQEVQLRQNFSVISWRNLSQIPLL